MNNKHHHFLLNAHLHVRYIMMTWSNGNIFPRYWLFVRESTEHHHVDSPHIGQWREAMMFPFDDVIMSTPIKVQRYTMASFYSGVFLVSCVDVFYYWTKNIWHSWWNCMTDVLKYHGLFMFQSTTKKRTVVWRLQSAKSQTYDEHHGVIYRFWPFDRRWPLYRQCSVNTLGIRADIIRGSFAGLGIIVPIIQFCAI